ncbi:MAG: TonB-dependent receptor [Candidatus Hydrogenedentota bacterium]|nr:MAG: TonB-dependent receptor [Candidatus Hydrogenedentota bacterium]
MFHFYKYALMLAIYGTSSLCLFAQAVQDQTKKEGNPAKKKESIQPQKKKLRVRLPVIEVVEDKPLSAASSRRVRRQDLKIRPITKPTDMLQIVPGLVTAQHAGGGKATQYFLRGFDLDHGTDLALSVDGMPINMVSHGHGQGYADIHFLIPEVYKEVLVRKGPYFVDVGDFGTAGAVEFRSFDEIPENQISVSGGMFQTYRTLFLHQSKSSHFKPILAVETYHSNGPFENPEKLKRVNLFFKNVFVEKKDTRLSLTAMGYASKWNASGQIPERAVKSGLISRFGSIDNSEGGSTQRFSLSTNYVSEEANAKTEMNAYWIYYNFNLFSNFTFYKDDPINGDQIAQFDRRHILGAEAKHTIPYSIFSMRASTLFGGRIRTDLIQNELYHSVQRKLIQPKTRSEITQSNLSAFLEQRLVFTSWVRFVGGARAEYMLFEVNDLLENKGTTTTAANPTDPKTSGQTDDAKLFPKANLIFSPTRNWDIFLNFGMGFHSNDARGTVIANDPNRQSVTPMTVATGYEVGSRVFLWKRLDLAASLWLLDLESEIVWVGDEGTTEASGRSRRYGTDLEARLRLWRWLYFDADVTINTAKFRDNPGNANSIALAPRLTVTSGITIKNLNGFDASIRLRHIGDRPANETGSLVAEGYTVIDAYLAYRYRQFEWFAIAKNITNTPWKEVQFATQSQLKGEANPVEEIHFVPGTPLAVEGGMRFFF